MELNEWFENRTLENLVLFYREELEKILYERRLRRKTVKVLKRKKLVFYDTRFKRVCLTEEVRRVLENLDGES